MPATSIEDGTVETCGVCRAALPSAEAWECRVCRLAVHAGCCDGRTLERTTAGRLASTCRTCHASHGEGPDGA